MATSIPPRPLAGMLQYPARVSVLLLWLFPMFALAAPCDDFPHPIAASPVTTGNLMFCFVATPAREAAAVGLTAPNAISIVVSFNGQKATHLHELPYSSTASRVDDAFILQSKGRSRLIILHSSDAPGTFEIAGRLHDVTVVDITSGGASVDDDASIFFGLGGDVTDAEGTITFRYPYKTRDSVASALTSRFFKATPFAPVEALVIARTSLYPEPDARLPRKGYLIRGDKVLLQKATAGWCQIHYDSRGGAIVRWTPCSALSEA